MLDEAFHLHFRQHFDILGAVRTETLRAPLSQQGQRGGDWAGVAVQEFSQ